MNDLVEKESKYEMSAITLINQQRLEIGVIDHCIDFFFGYAAKIEETSFEMSQSDAEADQAKNGSHPQDVIDYTELKRKYNLVQIKTYNSIKRAIWNCVMVVDHADSSQKSNDQVDLVLLRDLMLEI